MPDTPHLKNKPICITNIHLEMHYDFHDELVVVIEYKTPDSEETQCLAIPLCASVRNYLVDADGDTEAMQEAMGNITGYVTKELGRLEQLSRALYDGKAKSFKDAYKSFRLDQEIEKDGWIC